MGLLTQRALRVFSVLEAQRGSGDDIIDALLPFFEPMLGDLVGEVYNPSDFANKVREAYRWNFTSDIAEELIPRFLRRGWLAKIAESEDEKAYQVTYARPTKVDSETKSTAIGHTLLQIAERFEEFIREISPLTGYSRTREELADVLVEWLVSIDAYNDEILRDQLKHFEIQGQNRLSVADTQPREANRLDNEDRYLCARFVKKLSKDNSPWLPDLCRIASIGLLTEVIQDFSKPLTAVNRSNLAVYLDAPVAMDALGLSGKAAQDNVQLILTELQRIGCQVRIFRTSADEIQRVLRFMLAYHPADRTGATANAIRRGEVLERYAASVRDNPDPFLENCRISIVDRNLTQFPNTYEYFSADTNRDLYGAISWHLDPVPREHDAAVLTFIMRQRGGSQSPDAFQTRYLFVTKNGFLSQLARRFCVERGLIRRNQVPPAIHQRQLATMTWLRTGLSPGNDVPKRYLLAACERVLELKKGLIEKARHAVAELSTEQQKQLELLLTQDRSIQMMMDKTLGSSAVIDDSNMPELLDAMRRSLVNDIEKDKREEVAAVRRVAKAKIDAADEARKAAEFARADLERRFGTTQADDRLLIEGVAATVNRQVRRFRWYLNIILSIVLAGFATLPLATEIISNDILKYSLLVVGGVFSASLAAFQVWDRKTRLGKLVEWYACRTLDRLVALRRLESKLLANPLSFDRSSFAFVSERKTSKGSFTIWIILWWKYHAKTRLAARFSFHQSVKEKVRHPHPALPRRGGGE